MADIRLAHINDLDYLADVEKAAASIYPKGHIPADQEGQTFPSNELHKALNNELLFCAEVENKIVGFAACHPYKKCLHLDEISVRPNYGQQGIGSALVKEVIKKSLTLSLKGISLTTFSDIPWNAPFYEKLGFEILEENNIPRHVQTMLNEERRIGWDLQ